MIPGVPMIYIRRAVMIMEPPSPASVTKKETLEREKLGGLEGSRKRSRDVEDSGKAAKKKKKEPNPLSVKKKKKPENETRVQVGVPGDTPPEENEVVDREENVVGEVTDSIRRKKSTRRRKHHKKASSNKSTEVIPIVDE